MAGLEPEDPSSVGNYRSPGRAGVGGTGRVFLGRSPGGRAVAVTVVHAELVRRPEFRSRFRREVRAARMVSGAFTAPVIDAGPDARLPWLVTSYIAGPSLQEAVADRGPLPPASVPARAAPPSPPHPPTRVDTAQPLDERTGSTATDTAEAADGTANGVRWRAGENSAAEFDGASSQIATRGPVLRTGKGRGFTRLGTVCLTAAPGPS